MTAKNQSQLWTEYLSASERSHLALRKRCGLLRCDQPLKTHNFGIILLSQQFV